MVLKHQAATIDRAGTCTGAAVLSGHFQDTNSRCRMSIQGLNRLAPAFDSPAPWQDAPRQIHAVGGGVIIRFARDRTDLLSAQRLRYRVFVQELGARLSGPIDGIDRAHGRAC